MKLARAFILSFRTSAVVLASLFGSSIAAGFLVLEGGAPPGVVPWLFTAVAVGASGVAAFLARLFPGVGDTYPWLELTLAGILGWPIAWWTGLETKHALEGATTGGVFAISTTLEHSSLWNAAIVPGVLQLQVISDDVLGGVEPSPKALRNAIERSQKRLDLYVDFCACVRPRGGE